MIIPDQKKGRLFVIATPIGNLEDITIRAIRVLREVDLIACEDTRVTKKLLDHFDIKKSTVSYFQHSKLSKIDSIIEQLRFGKDIALVCDAGTPGISDAGQALVDRIMEDRGKEGKTRGSIKIIPIPGPSALTAAASVSGLIEKELYFAGFLPKKKGRQSYLKKLSIIDVPIIIYESTRRIEKTLRDIREYWGDRVEVFIAREMTKIFEECWSGPIDEVIANLEEHKLRGEIVLIFKKL